MGLSDSRHGHLTVIDSRPMLAAWPPPRRVSQVPRCDCPSAPSPLTPGCPVAARARCFTTGDRLHHLWQAGHTHKCNEAEAGSLNVRAHSFAVREVHSLRPSPSGGDRPAPRVRLPSHGGPLLHDERAIIMADSFQSASRTRLAWRTRGTESTERRSFLPDREIPRSTRDKLRSGKRTQPSGQSRRLLLRQEACSR
jgi:hypothetical protein